MFTYIDPKKNIAQCGVNILYMDALVMTKRSPKEDPQLTIFDGVLFSQRHAGIVQAGKWQTVEKKGVV